MQFQQAILEDPLYNTIPSVARAGWYLHAKNDHPEVRAKFFELLRQLPDFAIHIRVTIAWKSGICNLSLIE